MTDLEKSEGHCRCCSRRDRPERTGRWLGLLIRAIYEIVWDWPW
ncbi:hypothetical protein [Streptomyces olivaceus]|nr:hypothetical protein [Streptomyces olivaceus]